MTRRPEGSQGISRRSFVAAAGAVLSRHVWAAPSQRTAGVLRAGAALVDITPTKFPVIVNGGFLERRADKAHWPLHTRCLVLDDGRTRVAIAVVDNCLIPRGLLDEAKALAHRATGIPTERMLVSATHTHSAPSVVGALGSGVDEPYARFLPGRIAKAIELASKNLAPARAGWAVAKAPQHTHCRRWIRRPDKIGTDPFGERTVRAMMHPGYQNPDYVGPAGPIDPDLSILSVQSPTGRPIAMLANYSMHYYGAPLVSSDYYGLFAEEVARLVGAQGADPPFVAMMSQGTSGDLHWMDYAKPKNPPGIRAYAKALAKIAHRAYEKIDHNERASIAMCEETLTLRWRVPDEKRLAWAKDVLAKMKGLKPSNRPEVYARAQVMLDKEPPAELKLQALRIGELGITAIPCEVYGVTGLKLKAYSPLRPTFNMELANGYEGYIPPPEQHPLGGYTTWPALSAGLETQAEPKIVDAMLGLLKRVSGRSRRSIADAHGSYPKAVLAAKPLAYWRMGEFNGPAAADATGHGNSGRYEDGVAFYLEGPESPAFCGGKQVNRAPHFAGGRMKATVKDLGARYTVEMWFCNYLPVDVRPVTGYLFSRGADGATGAPGDHLGLGGKRQAGGKLIVCSGNARSELFCGTTVISLKTWYHVAMVRDGDSVTVHLNGNVRPEIRGKIAVGFAAGVEQVFIGGRSDGFSGFEGRIDEVAVYGRALSPNEIAEHYATVVGTP